MSKSKSKGNRKGRADGMVKSMQTIAQETNLSKKKAGSLTKDIATRERSVDYMATLFNALPNPDPVLKKLGKDQEAYEALLYDGRVKGAVGTTKSAIKSMEWELTGKNTKQTEIDFITDLFNGTAVQNVQYKMHSIFSEILDAGLFGYKPIEIDWEVIDNMLIPVNLVGKPTKWFDFDSDNNLRFLTRDNSYNGELVKMTNFILATNEATYDNPYGNPALAPCYWPVIFRNNGWKWYSVFIEKYGIPFLLAKAGAGAKEEDMRAVADCLADILHDGIAVVPTEYEAEMVEASKGSKGDSLHLTYLRECNNEINVAITGNNMTSYEGAGSFAAAKTLKKVSDEMVESYTKIVEDAFNTLLKKVHDLNFGDGEPPKFKLISEEEIDTDRAERDKKIQDADPRFKFTPAYYKKYYNLTDEDFTLEDKQPDDSKTPKPNTDKKTKDGEDDNDAGND